MRRAKWVCHTGGFVGSELVGVDQTAYALIDWLAIIFTLRRTLALCEAIMTTLLPSTLRSLSDSLREEPFYRAILADCAADQDRAGQKLRSYFDYAAREAAEAGKIVLCDPPDIGAALWSVPVDAKVAVAAKSARRASLEGLLGPSGFETYKKIAGFMGEASAPYFKDDWWYLSIAGISPSKQGKGHGSRLLAPTLAEADTRGAVCWLQTFTPRNHAFYERLGFKKAASIFEPNTQHDYAVMVRDGKAG